MTQIDIDAIRQRAKAATPGPWTAHPDGLVWAQRGGDPVSGSTEVEDAEFIAAARQDVDDLLAEVDRLRTEVNAMKLQAANVTHIWSEDRKDWIPVAQHLTEAGESR